MDTQIMKFKPLKMTRNAAFISIIIGLIMALFPSLALSYIVIAVGIGLIISAVLSMVNYSSIKKMGMVSSKLQIFNAAITMIGGVILILSPLFFIKFMVYIIALIILIASLAQLLSLVKLRLSDIMVPLLLFVFPSLLFIGSIILLISPITSVETVTMIFGISVIVYGLVDLYNYYMIKRK